MGNANRLAIGVQSTVLMNQLCRIAFLYGQNDLFQSAKSNFKNYYPKDMM